MCSPWLRLRCKRFKIICAARAPTAEPPTAFGDLTVPAALQQFQASHQLQVTGQLNQATAAALGLDPAILLGTQQAALPPPMPPPDTLQPGSVRALQDRLRSLGFYTGGVDGVWGQSTERAVEQFQQNRGLQPTGQLTPATVSSMGLSPDSLAYR